MKNLLQKIQNQAFGKYFDIVFLLAYGAACLYILPYHEPWSDEAQPWLLARDMSAGQLFHAMILNYDRHPGLWYFVMHFLASLKFSILGAAYANFLFCFSAAALLLFKAPFPRWFKYPFLLSYYMLYEYPILARHYSLTLLLMVLVALFYVQRHQKPILFSVVMFLLFNSAYITLGFTFAVALCYGFEFFLQKEKTLKGWASLAILAAGFALVMIQGSYLPPDHIDFGTAHFATYYKQNFFLFKTLFPYPGALSPNVEILISLAAAAAVLIALIPTPLCVLMLVSGFTLLSYIFKFHHWGDLRHYGFFIHISLIALWIQTAYAANFRLRWPNWPEKFFRNCFYGILALAFLSGIPFTRTILKMERHFEFSGGKWMASQIQSMYDHFNLADKGMVIVSHPHTRVVSVIAHLPQMQFWIPGLNRTATYYLNTQELTASAALSDAEVLAKLESNFSDLSRVLLLLDHPLEQTSTESVRYIPLVDMTQVPVHGYVRERFYLYKPVPK